jgi:hypothetical protein
MVPLEEVAASIFAIGLPSLDGMKGPIYKKKLSAIGCQLLLVPRWKSIEINRR